MSGARLAAVRLEKADDIVRLREVTMALTDVLQFGTFEKTRTVTAVLELGRNVIEHGERGRATFTLAQAAGRQALGVTVQDQGHGIPDHKLKGTGEIASETGLGLGLRGVQRIAERFEVQTNAEGTRIDAVFLAPVLMRKPEALIAAAGEAMRTLDAADPAAALTQQNRELMDSIADRDLLMRELHHRTGNNLTLIVALIRMSKGQSEAPETRQILGELETRVASLAKAHELMQKAANAGTIPAETLLREVARNAERAFNTEGLRVTIDVTCDWTQLEGRLATDIGLIVGELITNAYKHAFKGRSEGRITVTLSRDASGGLDLAIKDDGTGLADGATRPERSDSLGWKLIRTLAFQHDGTLTVGGEDGFTVRILFAGKP
ncbi:ATP-binding protein [Roseicyclus sp. F158]|uniref:histidine kinase n=1 Tax=Tropicimonas omnivorans TaxID=3075590 RepID=A0ABU3DKY2_9RHOB|nr:ATP-binding protein [Roseicyclus sp. F158]MDT0684363.1 ATP-binding protein [Roseicyclus sp. F158]